VAREAGEHVVEPHSEQDQVELYFVHRGSARFTLDGETFEAPAGTYVYLDEPSVRREAVALEAGTTVLSFGGPPVFAPSEWEGRWLREADDGR
jgi:quercetin dioxygenase-like cupin family protein